MSMNAMSHMLTGRTRLALAVSGGLLFVLVVALRVCLPTLALLPQVPQVSLLLRLLILVKLLSPLLSGWVAGVWIWLLLPLVARLFSHWHPNGGSKQRTLTHRWQFGVGHTRRQPERALPPAYNKQQEQAACVRLRQRYRSVAPLFQCGSRVPDATELPLLPPPWPVPDDPALHPAEAGEILEGAAEEAAPQEEPVPPAPVQAVEPASVIEVAAQPSVEHEPSEAAASAQEPGTPAPSTASSQPPPVVTLTLLQRIRAWVRADDGTVLEVKLRGGENAIRLIQLAAIAWRQGGWVDRDKLLTYVLSRGRRRDMHVEQLGEVFDSAKRHLRQDLDRAVKTLEQQGHPISAEVDFFQAEPGFYRLHPCCRVVDLAEIDAQYQTILRARKEGLLDEQGDGTAPPWVLEACQQLLAAYTGDVLHSLLEKSPEEFGSWVKEPVTLYRDRYLEALLILATHESALGKRAEEGGAQEQGEHVSRQHHAKAAQLFYEYALFALNSRWDQKVKFAYRHGKDGERVIRAARALRRCVVELGKLGNSDMIDQVTLAFKERMALLSEGQWKPDADTERDVAEAKRATTGAYRFSSQIASRPDGQQAEQARVKTSREDGTGHHHADERGTSKARTVGT